MVLYTPPGWLRHLSLLLLIPVFPLLIATYFPGRISAVLKHPLLVADRVSVKRRPRRPAPQLPGTRLNDVIAVVGGLGLYLAFVFGVHEWLIGVPPVAIR